MELQIPEELEPNVVAALTEVGADPVRLTLSGQVDEEFEEAAGKALRT